MVGRTIGRYRILERIGAGGMGEVYRAADEDLERDVAVKVLPAGAFDDPTARSRLVREARSAAALNHPNICSIYEVGETEGQPFIAMELIDGVRLSDLTAEGPLPQSRILRHGVELAAALAHAHDRGVLHRDLKSANVMIAAGGHLKMLDFGLAKRMSTNEMTDAVTAMKSDLTTPGTLAGTLAYMAPEQFQGRQADRRTDIWALGIVLYEMTAGARPFDGQTQYELVAAILHGQPLPLSREVDAGLKAVIERCLAKRPEERYQGADEVRAALEAIEGRARPFPARLKTIAATAILVAAVIGALIMSGLQDRFRAGTEEPRIQSLAVLPLRNLSGDAAHDYLADGMTEALIAELSKIDGIEKVVSRTSAMQYKGAVKTIPQIARELDVDGLIEGSVQREGEQVRVTVQLIHAPSDRHLWSRTFDREMRSVLSLQKDVTRAIAGEMSVALSPADREQLARSGPVNPAAYEAYLKGRSTGLSPADLENSIDYFELALKNDPDYALAYTGLANVWTIRAHFGLVPAREGWMKAKTAALRAVALDPTLAEAHEILAGVYFYREWDWAAAEREFERALSLNRRCTDWRWTYFWYLMVRRRHQEAQEQIDLCLESDPLNAVNQSAPAWNLMMMGRHEEAIVGFRSMLARHPGYLPGYAGLSQALHQMKMYEKSLDAMRHSLSEHEIDGQVDDALTRGYATGGYAGAMRAAAEKLAALAGDPYVQPTWVAGLYARAGQFEKAIDWLETGYREGDSQLVYIDTFPGFNPLRSNPRFQALLRRMNIPLTD